MACGYMTHPMFDIEAADMVRLPRTRPSLPVRHQGSCSASSHTLSLPPRLRTPPATSHSTAILCL